jgi:AcrR family transcriptional regulator
MATSAIHTARPPLATKMQPAQQRATETFERILKVAAETLADVGVERLSTNIVCKRAGLTPPALYRYFPNKYAVLSELGHRLMQAQNECIGRWISVAVYQGPLEELEAALEGLLLDTYETTSRSPGGLWIMRALRAVPALQEVRLASHTAVTDAKVLLLRQAFPEARAVELRLVSRIVVELVYSAVEMIFEESMDARSVASSVAGMLASHRVRLAAPPAARTRRLG